MSKADLIENMARHLRDHETDLGDERAVFRTLRALHFLEGDIVAYSDEAIELARRSVPTLTSVIGDGIALVFAAAVAVGWYVVLCPAVSSR